MEITEDMDIEAIAKVLNRFVNDARPVNQSGNGYITNQSAPKCGRAPAMAMAETVIPILNRLYPEWKTDNAASDSFEFKQERDASIRLIERIKRRDEIEDMLGPLDPSPKLQADQLHDLVWKSAEAQWSTGHLHEAVLAAAKAVNSQLQTKLDRRDVSEVKLVREAFTEKDPEPQKSRLRFTHIADSQTRESLRDGAMNFGAGCFLAIRNPVGHLPNTEHDLTEQEALERLAAFSLLARWIEEASLETT